MCKAFLEVTFYPLYFKLYIQSKQKDMDRKKKKLSVVIDQQQEKETNTDTVVHLACDCAVIFPQSCWILAVVLMKSTMCIRRAELNKFCTFCTIHNQSVSAG